MYILHTCYGISAILLPLSESTLNGSVVATSDAVADLFSSVILRSKSAILDCGSSEGSDTLEENNFPSKREKKGTPCKIHYKTVLPGNMVHDELPFTRQTNHYVLRCKFLCFCPYLYYYFLKQRNLLNCKSNYCVVISIL
jgi:hypothetical protein